MNSPWPHEREALAFVRTRLSNHEPYRAWTNVEFIAEDGSVNEVANGTMIEQAQILTSQNLAVLTGPVGLAARMHDQWPRLAERCFKRSEALAGRLTNNPRPLGTVKDAAYAWRQMIFYLSVADAQARERFVAWSAGELDGAIPDVQEAPSGSQRARSRPPRWCL